MLKERQFIYFLPRTLSILTGTIVFAFLTEATVTLDTNHSLISTVSGIIVAAAIISWAVIRKSPRTFALLPFSYWFGLFIYYLYGGFHANINIIQFIFLSLISSLITLLGYFAWTEYKTGGYVYFALGLIYLVIAFNNVSPIAIISVVGVLFLIGITYIYTPPDSSAY